MEIEKPTTAFFDTLGQYVYKYINEEGYPMYIGKGNGDRCLHHLKDKGYKIENCYIVARNLEKFSNKQDWQSFLLESFLIVFEEPLDNSVSGHYKECFVMASLSSMFSDWKSDQNDNFESFPDWYVENYDQLRGKLRIVQITSNNMYLESSMRNSINMKWYWSAGMEPVKVTFEAMHKDDGKNKFLKEKITEWLKTLGYKKTMPDGKDTKLSINCADINAVLAVFAEFNK